MHAKQARDFFLAAPRAVEYRVTCPYLSGVEAQKRQLPSLIGKHLEGKGSKRRLRIAADFLHVIGSGTSAARRWDVKRGGEIVSHGIQQRLDALVAERRTEKDRKYAAGEGSPPDGFP